MGEKGEGFSGTTIKDTWTKPSGECGKQGGEVGFAWGGGIVVRGNADNCT